MPEFLPAAADRLEVALVSEGGESSDTGRQRVPPRSPARSPRASTTRSPRMSAAAGWSPRIPGSLSLQGVFSMEPSTPDTEGRSRGIKSLAQSSGFMSWGRGMDEEEWGPAPESPSRNAGPPEAFSIRDGKEPELDKAGRRVVYVNDPDRSAVEAFPKFANNKIRTAKYTIITFLPRNIFEQFHRVAYIYFLIILILNQVPVLAVFGRTVSLVPLLSVLIVTAIKDAYEDWTRHRSDRVENARLCTVMQDGEWKPMKWRHVRVGNVVRLEDNETVPCDMVLLATGNESGVCYVETMNLDGESNLKSRYARQETQKRDLLNAGLSQLEGVLVVEHPNRNLYELTAFMDLKKQQLPLGATNILLRGTELRNTSWVIGVAAYTGQETKAMLNSSGAQSKRSKLEQMMNRETLWLAFILIVLCCIGSVGLGLWLGRHNVRSLPYYGAADEYRGPATEALLNFFSLLIIYQVMVPISLYISMELVRLFQSFFMTRDKFVYHEPTRTSLQVRALNINEDLGQVSYVFSDKTGTLTENRMEFHSCSVGGVCYADAQILDHHHKDAPSASSMENGPAPLFPDAGSWKPSPRVKLDPALLRALQQAQTEADSIVKDFMLVLAVCNTVVPTTITEGRDGVKEMHAAGAAEGGWVEYQGESPDEQALVHAAASYGYTLMERTSQTIIVNVRGQHQKFEVLGVHEFDSVRKRMSVVVRFPNGRVRLLIKGADTSMLPLLAAPNLEHTGGAEEGRSKDGAPLAATEAHLDEFARHGLRTLVVGQRELSAGEYEGWASRFQAASTAMLNRGRALREAAESIESNVQLLGATGIEDKLQDGVPETIQLLRDAGIKVWVLTGDKQETAISIAFSCYLLSQDMTQIIVNETTLDATRQALLDAKQLHLRDEAMGAEKGKWTRMTSLGRPLLGCMRGAMMTMGRPRAAAAAAAGRGLSSSQAAEAAAVQNGDVADAAESSHKEKLALIIDGNSLVHALNKELEADLYDLAAACEVVVCCRVAPLQKAGVVSLVKRYAAPALTLAIGDGANDVSMIQMADVGVGISGQEGRQAVMASDFAIAQFRFLKRLLLIHGHWCYHRLAYMVLYNFYRNAVFVLMLFWFMNHNAFSAQTAISEWNLVLYSLLYTSIPTIVVGTLDQDVSEETLMKLPRLYGIGQRDEGYNKVLFWITMLDTLWQSLVLFYVPYYAFQYSTQDLWSFGSVCNIGVVVAVNLHLAMDTYHWTWINHLAIWGSILVTFALAIAQDVLTFFPEYWVMFHSISSIAWWLCILLIAVGCLLPRFFFKVVRQRFSPSDVHIAREAELLNRRANPLQGFPVELDNADLPQSPPLSAPRT